MALPDSYGRMGAELGDHSPGEKGRPGNCASVSVRKWLSVFPSQCPGILWVNKSKKKQDPMWSSRELFGTHFVPRALNPETISLNLGQDLGRGLCLCGHPFKMVFLSTEEVHL